MRVPVGGRLLTNCSPHLRPTPTNGFAPDTLVIKTNVDTAFSTSGLLKVVFDGGVHTGTHGTGRTST